MRNSYYKCKAIFPRCVASQDGHYASCECPESCPNFGDSDDSQPVCSSTSKQYRNRCEMDREACHLGRNITVKFPGKCGESIPPPPWFREKADNFPFRLVLHSWKRERSINVIFLSFFSLRRKQCPLMPTARDSRHNEMCNVPLSCFFVFLLPTSKGRKATCFWRQERK